MAPMWILSEHQYLIQLYLKTFHYKTELAIYLANNVKTILVPIQQHHVYVIFLVVIHDLFYQNIFEYQENKCLQFQIHL